MEFKFVRRRERLTKEEKRCMGRAVPSEAFLAEAQRRRCRAIEPTPEEEEVCEVSEKEPEQDDHDRLAEVIQRIFPVEKLECSVRPPDKGVLRLISKPTRRSTKQPGRVEPGLPAEAPQLALLRKDRTWDCRLFPLRKNSIDLVKGASAWAIERVLGGKFVFIQDREVARLRGKQGHPLHDFREKLLKKWPTIQDAFHAIDSYLSKVTKPMNVQEWAATLSNLGLVRKCDARVIYELLDENKDGDLTLDEFHWGIETVAPVLCMETLRKRLLCLGFPSMTTALSAMHGPGQDLTMLPLSFERFSECLSRAWIIQPEEHRAIFEALKSPALDTVTLSELLCGLQGVSPPLVLEDLAVGLREANAWAKLKEALGVRSDDEEVSAATWRRTLKSCLGFHEIELDKLLPMMDIDGIDGISLLELQSVLVFAEPCISLEGSRKKVQQGFRSIEIALQNVLRQSPKLNEDSKFGKKDLEFLLSTVEGVELWELAPVMSFVTNASGHGVSVSGFLKGLRLFAPCAVLESLRMQLLGQGMAAFQKVRSPRAALGPEAFAESLREVGVELSPEETSLIFELLDVRSSHVVTISELIALLQCSRPRGRLWRPSQELRRQIAFDVHQDLAPIQHGLHKLKQGIRSCREVKEVKEVKEEGQQEVRGATLATSSSAPELRRDLSLAPRRTFQRITSTLSRVPNDDEHGSKIVEIRQELGGYFESNQRFVKDQEDLLQPVPKAEGVRAHRR